MTTRHIETPPFAIFLLKSIQKDATIEKNGDIRNNNIRNNGLMREVIMPYS